MRIARSSLPAAALLVLSLPLVAGYLGRIHPALDSFGHFRAHLGFLLVLAGLAAFSVRLRLEAVLSILLGLGSIATTIDWPWLQPPGLAAAPTGAAKYRLLQMNLRFDNAEPNSVLSLVARTGRMS